MRRVLSAVMAFLLVAALLVVPMDARAAGNAASESRNGVVRFLAIYYSEDMWATGSGLAVGEEGEPSNIFVTNQHVVEGADEVYVMLDNQWDLSVPAFGGVEDGVHAVKCEVLSQGPEDFAIVRASRVIDERVSLPLMLSHQANPGDQVYALGFPGVSDSVTDTVTADIDSMTVTSGTISRFTYYEYQRANAIQIDADINHGNSGGPLITEEGYVIGLNSWASGNEDGMVNLAIEIDYVIDRLDMLVADGTLSGFTYTLLTERPEPDTQPAGSSSDGGTSDDGEEEEEDETTNLLLWVAIGIGVLALVSVFVLKSSIDKIRRQRTMSKRVSVPSAPAADSVPKTEPRPKVQEGPSLSSLSSPPPVSDSAVTVAEPVEIRPSVAPAAVPAAPAARAAVAAFAVVGISGKFAGKRFPVAKDMRVGRNPDSDIAYPGDVAGISGNHCTLSPRENGIVLIDVGSSYGSFLPNGTKLNANQKYLLKPGDMFCLGNKEQMFRIEPVGGAAPKAVPHAGATYTLAGTAGQFAGRKMTLNKPIRIGRAPGSDIQYPGNVPGISGNHCSLTPTAEGVVLVDLGSSYGTFQPNGTKLEPNRKYLLKKGDSFCLANPNQRFTIE